MSQKISGAEGSRTLDLLHAMQALSQLSYGPLGVSSLIPKQASKELEICVFC